MAERFTPPYQESQFKNKSPSPPRGKAVDVSLPTILEFLTDH